jgi:hypothetical protein
MFKFNPFTQNFDFVGGGGGGGSGDDGWTPILSVVSDGERRVLQVVDWTGGDLPKPTTGLYVGATGLEALIANGVDIRGAAGANGTNGTNGWSPILAVVSDGERRVLQVTDWTGGTGSKPATGSYIGATGLEALIANGVDIRGATGAAGAAGGTTPYETVTESGTTRTLGLTDARKYIRLTSGSSCAITLPNQATVAWVADTEIAFRVAAAGIPTFTLGGSVTLNDPKGIVAALVQGDTFAIKRVAEDIWDLI